MNLDISNSLSLVRVVINGANGEGPIAAPGLLKGDILFQSNLLGFVEGFENVVTVDGQIQQTISLDWSSLELTLFFLRGSFS